MINIVVVVRDGVLDAVFSGRRDVQITLVDWDDAAAEKESYRAGRIPCDPLRMMPKETAHVVRRSKQVRKN